MKVNSKERSPRRRLAKGNMLFMCISLLAIAIVFVGLGTWVYFLFFSQKLLKNHAESFSLQAAQKLNPNDFAGKLNNLMGRSRELIFTARQMHSMTEADPELQSYEALAAQVLSESRESINFVSDERERFAKLSIVQLRQMLKEFDRESSPGLSLLSASACNMRIHDLRIGWLSKVESNVEASGANYDLLAFDRSQNYLIDGKNLSLYRGNVNLKLPGEDSDLDFVLSPLSAPVKGKSAPMRLVLADSFKDIFQLRKDGQNVIGDMSLCPSAVQVVMTMAVKEKVVGKLESGTMTIDTASTNGAGYEPD